jgi:SNF family Na+-dependent transporter
MQPLNQRVHTSVQARYPRLVVLWFGQLMSIGALVCFSLFLVPEASDIPGTSPGPLVRVMLTALGVFFVVVSFVVKRKFLERSVEKQQIDLVQKAFVIAVAMCEVSALLGVIERFLMNNRDYYFLFALAAVGIAFHFPRREHLVAATYKASANESTF